MTNFLELEESLRQDPKRWLVTGVAGFIGSHLLETLLRLGQKVVGLDNFATGHSRNLVDVMTRVGPEAFSGFRFIEGDIRDAQTCALAAQDAELVLHQAALGSVPRSMLEPRASHASNVDGFLNVLLASHEAGVKRFVYASSSSVYGDEASEPKVEERIGRPLSPYAATKAINEVYAGTFRRTHGIQTVGLRYFNVFGPRQDPQGAYAAVIPRWAEQLISGEPCVVFGDGSASRDFCYVENVVQANLLAALAPTERLGDGIFNVACGARTSLLELFDTMRGLVAETRPEAKHANPVLSAPRAGDIPHSFASIERARELLGYRPTHDVARGLAQTVQWYIEQAGLRCNPALADTLQEAS